MPALVLRKTAAAVESLLNLPPKTDFPLWVDLEAGLLWIPRKQEGMFREFTDEISEPCIVGVGRHILRQLSVTSGSWVVIRNPRTNISRPARVVVLDPPLDAGKGSQQKLDAGVPSFLPSCTLASDGKCEFQPQVAYVSPLLAFNLGLHLLWLESRFDKQVHGSTMDASVQLSIQAMDAEAETKLASHVRITYLRVPASSGLKDSSPSDRQKDVDTALQRYFERPRILSAGDVFSVRVVPSTISTFYHDYHFTTDDDLVFFKVIDLEPSSEFLCVHRSQTAMVLSGSIPSDLPPLVLKYRHPWLFSLHSATISELISLLAPCLHPDVSPLRVAALLFGPEGVGKRTIVRRVAEAVGINIVEYNCYELVGASEATTAVALENAFAAASRYSPAILLLRRFDALGSRGPEQKQGASRVATTLKMCISAYRKKFSDSTTDTGNGFSKAHVLLVAAAESEDSVKDFRSCFTHELFVKTPDESQRLELLEHLLSWGEKQHFKDNILEKLKTISSQTAGLVPRDICTIAADISAMALVPDASNSETELTPEFLDKALGRSKERTASAIGTPQVPNVKWEDIGGLEDVKRAILDTVQVPLLHRELFTSGLRQRSGVLLYGPPGTGKTLLAKAVATECSLNFLSVKGPELINMFIGESEKNVREIFQKARGARPCVVFFDELDALAPARGASGDSGGVMDRVVSQMLAEIDGLGNDSQDLFVIGATNRPDLIDSALLRPGRFDKILYVGISTDSTYREKVLSALARKFDLDEDVSLKNIARKCPQTFTGADMYALCADAWMQAVKRKVGSWLWYSYSVAVQALEGEEDSFSVVVDQGDFMHALAELKPSLSTTELEKYEKLRLQFQG